jgi:TonB-linked SusC/RagA family outer membrane protein
MIFINFTWAGANHAVPKSMEMKMVEKLAITKKDKVDVTVSGTVTDPNGEAIPGVTVSVLGTTIGTATDLDGNYSLTVPEGATLVFSFIGFEAQRIDIGDRSVVDVTLVEDMASLDEVVVIGYGSRLKEELSGSVSSITSEKMNISTEASAMGRLQGHVSGVTVSTANTPGGSANVRIRGLGTINDANPLYVIDGIPTGPSNNINPNDIESISILKDASSAGIYGTRGANGVVIITTKKGRKNQPTRINFVARTGIKQAVKSYDLLNTEQYGEMLWITARNQGNTPGEDWGHPHYGNGTEPRIPDYIFPAGAMEGDFGTSIDDYSYDPFDQEAYGAIIRANKEGTDWFDEIVRNGVIQEYNLSVEGGGENVIYSTSASYLKENGILDHTGFERFSFRNNTEGSLFTDRLRIGQSLMVSLVRPQGELSNNAESSPIANTFKLQPIIPVYDIKGNYAGSRPINLGESRNPRAQLDRAKYNKNRNFRILGSLFTEAKIMEDLTFKSLFGYNYGHNTSLSRTIPAPEHYQTTSPAVNTSSSNSFQWNWSNTLDYNTTISGIHRLNVILGTEAVENSYDWVDASRIEYFSLDPGYMQLSAGEGEQRSAGSGSEWSLFSVFGRINYNLMRKYIFEATVRRDGSSRFGMNNRFATFPAGSVAWIVSEENFLSQTKNWLDFFKLRFGAGVSGNDRIGDYNIFSTFGTDITYASYDINGTNNSVYSGFMPIELGNPAVGWETTETLNLGLDLVLLNNSINMSVDVWQRNTSDMLYRLAIPEVSGISTAPYVNIGNMKNAGFDLELGYSNTALSNKIRYSMTATLSNYVNELVNLSDNINEEIIMGGYRNINYLRSTGGRSFPEFYGYIVDGFFQTQEEVDNHPKAFGEGGNYNQLGRFKYRDFNEDGVINNDDMTYIGNPHPDFTGGFNMDIGYGYFDLNMFFYGSYGNDMLNLSRRLIDFGMFDSNYSTDVLYRSWGSPYLDNNENAILPIHDLNDGSVQPSTAFIEDGSFLRFKSLRLNYTFPDEIRNKLQIQNLRIYGQVTNLFTLTNYSGLDPELSTSVNRMGLDLGAWPTPREIIVGISVGL